MKRVTALLIVVVLAFLAYPYLSLYFVYRSINGGDEAALQNQADWDAVRAGFKDDLNAAAAREAERNRKKLGPLGEVLTNAIAPAIVEGLVDTYVTPRGVIALVRSGGDLNRPPSKDESPTRASGEEKIALTWAFFDAPNTFRISFDDPKNPDLTGVSLLLGLDGAQWKITRVKLPIANLQDAAHKL